MATPWALSGLSTEVAAPASNLVAIYIDIG